MATVCPYYDLSTTVILTQMAVHPVSRRVPQPSEDVDDDREPRPLPRRVLTQDQGYCGSRILMFTLALSDSQMYDFKTFDLNSQERQIPRMMHGYGILKPAEKV